jgi:hypothetical protein
LALIPILAERQLMALPKVATSVTSLSGRRLSGNKTGNRLATDWQQTGNRLGREVWFCLPARYRHLDLAGFGTIHLGLWEKTLSANERQWTRIKSEIRPAEIRKAFRHCPVGTTHDWTIYDLPRLGWIWHDSLGFGYGSRNADFLVGGCTGLSSPVFPCRSIFRTQEQATGKSPAPADKNVGATTRGDNPTAPVGRRGALRRTRPAIFGGAFRGWRLAIAHLMALFGHAPILAHHQDRCYFPTTIPVIFIVTTTFEIRLRAKG